MSYAEYAASAPVGVLELHCLELSHPDWPTPLRLVRDYQDWTVTLEDGVTEATFSAAAFDTGRPSVDDSGVISRSLRIDAVGGAVLPALLAVAASDEPVQCTFRVYLSNDLSAPQFDPPEVTDIRGVQINAREVVATATTEDLANTPWPNRRTTTDNTPGLRR